MLLRVAHDQSGSSMERRISLGVGWNAEVKDMSKNRTWGDEITLRAVVEAYGCIAHVITWPVASPCTDPLCFNVYLSVELRQCFSFYLFANNLHGFAHSAAARPALPGA